MITHALLSVSDKSNIIDFAQSLHRLNITLISTGATAALLREHQIPVTEVSQFTSFPEILNGRVKTLHPRIYGGILGRPGIDDDVLHEHNIPLIGLVVVNLYPFEETISQQCSMEEAIENVDIGGPTLLRAAAKNYQYTTVVVSKNDYAPIIEELKSGDNKTSLETRFTLAKKVFAHVAKYDAAISNYFSSFKKTNEKVVFPDVYTSQIHKKMDLRYGENPHQMAAFYTTQIDAPHEETFAQHSGKLLSYNNIADADTAMDCVKQFSKPSCVIVKHANPCACASANTQLAAYTQAYAADPTSAFGGIIAFNTILEPNTIAAILAGQFVEVIVAPAILPEALTLASQKSNLRILTIPFPTTPLKYWEVKRVNNGILLQESDNQPTPSTMKIVTQRKPSPQEEKDLLFAWQVVRFVKSNAIVFAKNEQTVGIGAGQMSRVFSIEIAAKKAQAANLSLQDTVMASDAFFPFKDSIDLAKQMGISAIIQPGGSVRDEEVIAAADKHGIAMIFTDKRHFRH